MQFVLLEGSFDGVGGLAFAFEVFGVVLLVGVSVVSFVMQSCLTVREREGRAYHARPALVGSAFGGVLDHHVCAFVVIVYVAVSVLHPWWYHGDSVQWAVFLDAVFDHFSRGCLESFFVRCADGLDGAVCVGHVSS